MTNGLMDFWAAWPKEVPAEFTRMPPRLKWEVYLGSMFVLNLVWLAIRALRRK